MSEGHEAATEVRRSFDAQRSRELSERQQPADLTVSFKPFKLPTIGAWNLLLCVLGVAILIAAVIVNMMA